MREPKLMGRPREFNEEEALAKIMDVFWARGFEGATVSDLMAATGLKKGSLYAAFGDKRAMYLKALALWIRDPETLRDFLYARMRGVREDTEEKPGKNNDLDDEALTLLREIRDELRNRRLTESGADD